MGVIGGANNAYYTTFKALQNPPKIPGMTDPVHHGLRSSTPSLAKGIKGTQNGPSSGGDEKFSFIGFH